MPSRTVAAQFLQGLFVFPCCCLFGLMEALLFHLGRIPAIVCIAVIGSIPLIGTLRTRQWALMAGLLTGLAVSVLAYLAIK